ncbi:MAG: hydrogenase formation protein HypD, partial [Pseudomonadales bacterium]
GNIPRSGLRLRHTYQNCDARQRFELTAAPARDANGCIAGDIMKGGRKPPQCPHFGADCHPEQPLGAPMVSSEGACAAYYRYRQQQL